jgi:cyclohexyl-isocyanide hydratase
MAMRVGMLLYPSLTQLDLTGPFEVFTKLPGTEVFLAWKTIDAVRADSGLALLPTTTLADAPQADVLFVPGGSGQIDLMADGEVLSFLRGQAAGARYVTSVCTGAFLLGAAGLLDGYRATTHWAFHDLLARCGAIPVKRRVVVDRNRITGGGVTAGIDFALRVAAELHGEHAGQAIELALEYDPEPPFRAGSPDTAPPEIVTRVRDKYAPFLHQREAMLRRLNPPPA